MTRPAVLITLVAAGLGVLGTAVADPPSTPQLVEQARLEGDDSDNLAVNDQIASVLAVSGEVTAVGMAMHDYRGDDAGAVLVLRRVGGEWVSEARLTASDAHPGQYFGDSVAVLGDVIVVGAPGDNQRGSNAGAAYLFEHTGEGWTEVAKLTATDAAGGDACGGAVGLGDGTVFLACQRDDRPAGEDAGSVRVFERAGSVWEESAVLVAPDGGPSDNFGSAIAATGDRVVVGARGHDHGLQNAGAAYVFSCSTGSWSAGQELLPAGRAAGDSLGDAVAMAGDTIAVGAWQADGGAVDSGSVWVFTLAGEQWLERARLGGSNGSQGDAFGRSVAIAEGRLAVGAPQSDMVGANAGVVYLFEGSAGVWSETSVLSPTGLAVGDGLGRSVGLAGAEVLAGAPFVDAVGTDSGAVFVFSESAGSWSSVRVVGPGTPARDWFGYAVAVDGDTALVGSPADDRGNLVDTGSCSVFVRSGGQWHREAALVPHDARRDAQFGAAVALDGDLAVVAAPKDSERAPQAGAVYVFARGAGGWVEQAKLAPSELASQDYLGLDLALDGTTVVAAAGGGSSTYVFSYDGSQWSQEDRLQPFPRPVPATYFSAVAIAGELIVVGGAADPGGNSAYVYRRDGDGWELGARLSAPGSSGAGWFGGPVGIAGTSVLVGAPREEVDGVASAGGVYVYSPSGMSWEVVDHLTAPSPTYDQVFGFHLANDGDRLVVGAPWAGTVGYPGGMAYLYERSGGSWQLEQTLQPAGSQRGDQLGFSVDLSGTTVLAGAWAMDAPAGTADVGAAFVFAPSSGELPEASFTFTPASPGVGESVTFTDTSTGEPVSWQWSFGDGASSVAQHPAHVYLEAGTYQATLSVSNEAGTDTASAAVTVVAGPPTASFAWSPADPTPGQAVSFLDTSAGGPVSWQWSFGDGAASSERNPTHTFAAAGSYPVELAVSNSLGESEVATEVVVATVPEPLTADLSLPAVARVPGIGAVFTSRVDLLNPSSEALELYVRYTPRVDVGGDSRATVVTLEPQRMVVVEDPLRVWFGFTGSEAAVGSLLFTQADGAAQPMVQSVITGRNPDGSEYGQLFPAALAADALGAGTVSYLPTTVDASHNRVNVGVMALVDGSTASLVPVDPIGNPLASPLSLSLDTGANQQVNDLFRVFNLSPRDNILLALEVTTGKVVSYASVIDGYQSYTGTNDPTTVRPLQGGSSVTLLELGSVQGFDEFSGSASLTNLGQDPTVVRADLYLRGEPGVANSVEVNVGAGETVGYVDFVAEVFGSSGLGTVVLTSLDGALIAATGREFSIFRDQDEAVVGTAGQLIPGLRPEQILTPGVSYRFLGLLEEEHDDDLERSHLAVFNPGQSAAELEVTLFDGATGASEGEMVLPVRAGELVQVNSIIPRINPAHSGGAKWLEVVSTQPVHAEAFRVNTTGDPVTIEPLSQ